MTQHKIPVLGALNLIPTNRLGIGAAQNNVFLRGDGSWGSPVKVAQVWGTSLSPSTNSSNWVDIPEMSLNMVTERGPTIFQFWSPIAASKAGINYFIYLTLSVDGIWEDPWQNNDGLFVRNPISINSYDMASFYYIRPALTPINHTFKVRWRVGGNMTITAYSTDRLFTVMNLTGY